MQRFPYKILDLTHALSPGIPTWDGSCGFDHHLHHDYEPGAVYQFRTHKINMNEGIGTHMDAPAHCIEGGATIDKLQLADLAAPCAVIDVSAACHERYRITPQDIHDYEKAYGSIAPGSFVMMRTGWERFWNDPAQYRNNHFFPSISADAAALLLDKNISGIGIDTLSPDRPEDGFPVHKLILGAGKHIVENAANLGSMPPQGGFTLVAPIKIQSGTEAPIRLIGFVHENSK
jgi:kynurenine formamidase